MKFTGEQLRAAMLDAMEDLWASAVRDPEDYDSVTRLFVENGWGFQVPNGYRNQPGAEYCGHTVAVAMRRVGDYLVPGMCMNVLFNPKFLTRILASTSRLADLVDLEKEIPGRAWTDLGYDRDDFVVEDPNSIEPGDIVVVVTSANKPHGDHITLARTKPDENGNFDTYEGNARGQRGDGSKGKGVVKRQRNIADVRQVIRVDERLLV